MNDHDRASRTATERAIELYRSKYEAEPTMVVRAPGRVNLIGEHTDYNDGFVLPMGLPYAVAIAASPRTDDSVTVESEGFGEVSFAIADPVTPKSWGIYVHGTAKMLLDSGFAAAGWDGVMASDIPGGASLSSSAALEVASGLAYTVAAGASIEPQQLAKVGQRVENEVLGLPSGILDQLASAAAVDGAASLIDCRDLSTQAVPLPDGVDIVIMDTGTRRELVDSEYAARQADCQAAAKALGVAALRDATLDELEALTDDILVRRARHVIAENQRTLDAAQAMRDGDVTELGLLMNASHASLRDDYEVSGPALDRIVAVAQDAPGCLGARMTGGGFAGAAVALVESADTASFIATVLDQFTAPPQQPSTAPVRLYPVRPGPGATIVTSP